MRSGAAIVAACVAAFLSCAPSASSQTAGSQEVQARAAEDCLLGSDGEVARWRALLPFKRQFQVETTVTESLAPSLAAAGVPVAATYEALGALSSTIDLERDVHDGDRFYVRWEETFIGHQPVGIGRVLSLELVTKSPTAKDKGTIAIARFRPLHQPRHWEASEAGRFWIASGKDIGKLAAPPPIRLPLDAITITSGFGLRSDPLDQPARSPPVMAAPQAEAEAAAPPPPPPRKAEDVREINRAAFGFGYGSQLGGARDTAVNSEHNREVDRIMAERRVRAREEAARKAAEQEAAERAAERAAEASAAEQAAARLRPPPAPKKPTILYMHEGLDLLGHIGTPIYAAADGLITLARPDRGYGTAIHIEHADRMSTIYGHLSQIAPGIEAARIVERGELIGFVGSTGRSTGAHLHFELLLAGKPVDPQPSTKDVQLDAFDLARFKKQLAAGQAERELEQRLALEATTDGAPPSVAESLHARPAR